jgi:Tfp pilus assembly protein PilP
LSGVATEGNSRSAFLQTVQGVIEVREGDTVPPDYRVSRITEDAVELVTGDGTTRRIVLRP